MDFRNRIFGAGHRILTIVGALAGGLVALGQYLDLVPPEYRSSKWYAIAAALVALGAALKMPSRATAPAVTPLVLLAASSLLFAAPARAQEHVSIQIGSVKGAPIMLTAGLGVSGYGYDFGTRQVLRGVTLTGLGELAFGAFPVAAILGGGFQAGENQGLALQAGPEYRPLNVALLFNAVVLGGTQSYGLVAGYVIRF